jgi:2,3-bisphosphoglycerate-independent phosphoglycerate mutase
MRKAILLIIDGLGDLPTPKTPLQAAKTPNLDRLAKNGITGMMSPVRRFTVPGSDTGHLNLLGYDPAVFYCGRGPFEALGMGIELQEGDVAFRANFATAENGKVVDRRAGRIDTKTASLLSKGLSFRIGNVQAIFRNSVEHRGVLVLRGPNLSANVSDTDPHTVGEFNPCFALDDSWEAKRTADIVNKFTEVAKGWLASAPANKGRKKPANMLLLRGPGTFTQVPSFYDRFKLHGLCVAGGALYKGVAAYLRMDVALVPGATADIKSNLKGKAEAAANAIKGEYDFVFMHVKAPDSAAHDGDFDKKKKALELLDKVIPILEKTGACLIITGDHSTPCSLKKHTGHEVPIIVHGGERKDGVKKFDEISCGQGGLGHVRGKEMIPLILNITGRAEKYGS